MTSNLKKTEQTREMAWGKQDVVQWEATDAELVMFHSELVGKLSFYSNLKSSKAIRDRGRTITVWSTWTRKCYL